MGLNITKLKEQVAILQRKYQTPKSEALKDKILYAYRKRVVTELESILQDTTNPMLVADLEELLETNWHLIKGTMLSYTALPDDELTELLIDIAQYVADSRINAVSLFENKDEIFSALWILMPTLRYMNPDSYIKPINGLFKHEKTTVEDVKQIIKTHINSEDGTYLIPILLLTEMHKPFTAKTLLFNPYFDYVKKQPPSEEYISQVTIARLTNHSKETRALACSLSHPIDVYDGSKRLPSPLYSSELLKKQIENKSYSGKDSLGLTEELLNKLNIKLYINSPEDLEIILNSNTDEIAKLYRYKFVRQQILLQFENLNQLIKFASTASSDKLEVILKPIASELLNNHLRLSRKFAQLLHALDEGRSKIICLIFKERLLQITNSCDYFYRIIKELESKSEYLELGFKQGTFFFDVIKSEFIERIQCDSDLGMLLEFADIQECGPICQQLKKERPEIFNEKFNIGECFSYLPVEKCKVVWSELNALFPHYINGVLNVKWIQQILAKVKNKNNMLEERGRIVYNDFKNDFTSILERSTNFMEVVGCLPLVFGSELYQSFESKLIEMIHEQNDLVIALNYLPIEVCKSICNTLKNSDKKAVNVNNIIEDQEKLGTIFFNLNANKYQVFFAAFKERLTELFLSQDLADIGKVMKSLEFEKELALCNALRDILPEIIKTNEQLITIDEFVKSDRSFEIICKVLDVHLLNSITSPPCLSVERNTIIVRLIEDKTKALRHISQSAQQQSKIDQTKISDYIPKLKDKVFSTISHSSLSNNLKATLWKGVTTVTDKWKTPPDSAIDSETGPTPNP